MIVDDDWRVCPRCAGNFREGDYCHACATDGGRAVQEIVDEAYKALIRRRLRDAVEAISPSKPADEVQPTAIVESKELPDTVYMSRADDPTNFDLPDDVAAKLKEIFPKPSTEYS